MPLPKRGRLISLDISYDSTFPRLVAQPDGTNLPGAGATVIVPARAQLPRRYAGLTIGYRVLDINGAEVTPHTTAHVTETAPADYFVIGGIDAPPAGGLIIWGTTEQPSIAAAEIAPPPVTVDPTPAIAALGDRIAQLIAAIPQPVAITEVDTAGLQQAIAGVGVELATLTQKDAGTAVLLRLAQMEQEQAIIGAQWFGEMSRQIAMVSEAIATIEPSVVMTHPPADLAPVIERLTGLGAGLARVETLVQPLPTPPPPNVDAELEALDQLLETVAANHKERVLAPVVARLTRQLAQAFRVQGRRFVRSFGELRSQFTESAALRETITSDDWLRLFDRATGATTDLFLAPLQRAVQLSLSLGAENAIADVGINHAFSLRNPRAEAYLQEHGYGLISQIDAVTRGNIATIIDEGVRAGWSYNQVAREISRLYSEMAVGRPQQHIESRAHLIAVNEAGMAYEEGNFIVVRDLQDAGLLMEKAWLTVGDERVSATICRPNQGQGWIPLEQSFQSGHMRPLGHVACRCTALYRRRAR